MFLAGSVAIAQTPVPGGSVSGTWTEEGSPYLINGLTYVKNGENLTIEPGVTVEWQGHYTMYIEGQILAMGLAAYPILFTAADTSTGFNSIRFMQTSNSNDTSRFVHCIFKYGKTDSPYPENSGGAIAMKEYGKVVIDQCLFEENHAQVENEGTPSGGAIALWESSPIITNTVFKNNVAWYGGAIMCYYGSNAWIENNQFIGNKGIYGGGAMVCYINSHPSIRYNLFYQNMALGYGGAIQIYTNCSPWLFANTITENEALEKGGAIELYDDCDPDISNTIVWNNTSDSGNGKNQICIWEGCEPSFMYSDIEYGEDSIFGYNNWMVYSNCLDEDPLFTNPEAGEFYLTEDSPCIDAGDPDFLDPDSSISDIGAYYWYLGVGLHELHESKGTEDLKISPNPFRDQAMITYHLNKPGYVRITIYNSSGQSLIKLLEDWNLAGRHSLSCNLSGLNPGIYLLTLICSDQCKTIKAVKY